EQRSNNLQDVSKQLNDIATQQQSLDGEIWKFADEENFFSLWTDLSRRAAVTASDPIVADAIPSSKPVSRSVMINVTGPINNVLTFIHSFQSFKPVIAITAVNYAPATLTNQVTATVEATTLWH